MAGLIILKCTHDLSDEVLCDRWVENPHYQFFCGKEFGPVLRLARRVRDQQARQRGPKVHSLHAPEVECIVFATYTDLLDDCQDA